MKKLQQKPGDLRGIPIKYTYALQVGSHDAVDLNCATGGQLVVQPSLLQPWEPWEHWGTVDTFAHCNEP